MNWHPIATAPMGQLALFWVVAKPPDECYCDTAGNVITAFGAEPRIVMGKHSWWSSLEKGTHWMPLPAPPEDTKAPRHD